MATITGWSPFGVSLNITATAATVTRISATQYTVKLNVSWECYWDGNQTNYGMSATSGGKTVTISSFGTKRSNGSSTLTGTYSISGNGAATKSVTVTFKNYEEDWQGNVTESASKNVTVSVSVPALASYAVKYNANGGSGAPSAQTKWKDQALKLSITKPTRTGYTFAGWATSASGSVAYTAGANYTANAAVTLYAKWTANTYTVKYDANGGTGAPGNQTKTYGVELTLSNTKPTRTNYTFKGWGTSASDTTVAYAAGASYTANAAVTLYAIWELAYTKPRITDLSVSRCNAAGDPVNNGTCARVAFSWACDKTVSSISVHWTSADNDGSATITASGTSGTVNAIIGNDSLNANNTYNMEIVVADSVGSSAAKRTLNSLSALIHGLPEYGGLAFGKTAELEGFVDFGKFKSYHRQNAVFENDKNIVGKDVDGNEYAALMPVTASGNTSLGYGLYKAKKGNTHLYGHKVQFYTNEGVFLNSNKLVFNNNAGVYGLATDGSQKMLLQISENNIVIGYDNYNGKSGNTNIYGHDIYHYISNLGTPGLHRPYRRRGDSHTLTIRTSGYVTNAGTEVYFFIPFTVPIIGSPTVSAASGDGFILRQGNKYTHGSAASTYVKPTSYTVERLAYHGVQMKAVFSNTTNVTNNETIGIHWNGTITFS